jgi:hypothetical protein
MSNTTTAREFVASCELPPAPVAFEISKGVFDYDTVKAQAAVVGAQVIAFAAGVPAQAREDVASAALLAQLVAKKKVPAPTTLASVTAWYDAYFDTLSHIGFAIQDHGFAAYSQASKSFEAHEAILEVAAALFAGAPAALAVVTQTLEALKKLPSSSGWIRVFNRESQSANTARFQVSLVGQDNDGSLFLSIIAFGLEAKTTLTQVLFFKFQSNEVRLENHSGKVSINAQLLEGIRDQMTAKLAAHASDFIGGIEI